MAAPVYTSDLTDIYAGAGSTTGWSALGGGQAGLNAETDYFIQGTGCTSKNAFANDTKGMIYNNGTGVTIPTDGAVLMWQTHQTANSLDTQANGGWQALVGSGTTAYRQYYVAGSDTIVYDDRWKCIPINPTITPSATTGSPTTNYQYFGILNKMVGGPTKGSPQGCDAIRYGRVQYDYTNGDLANGYATFLGAAVFNDNVTRRYGQLQLSKGTYFMQGLHSLGTATTAVDFRDANKTINIINTEFVTSGFNSIVVNNASSNVEWTNINISALGTVSRGNFVINNNATVLWQDCIFTDVGTFSLGGTNTTVLNSTFRRTDTITLNGSDLTNCLITNSRAASSVVAADLATITGCTFISDGSNHAVELTSIGTGTMTWDNIATGYVAGTAGSPVTPGSTGNETIYVNVNTASDLTINVAAGATTPSIRVGASFTGNVNVVSTFTLTLTGVPAGNQVTIVNSTTRDERQNTNPTTGGDITYSHSGGETVDILVIGLNIDPNSASIYDLTLENANQTIPINTSEERNYDNPA
jgi:hypothetical protein